MKSKCDGNYDDKILQCFWLHIGYFSPREMELIDSFKSLTGLVLPSTFLPSKGFIFSQEFQCLTRGRH